MKRSLILLLLTAALAMPNASRAQSDGAPQDARGGRQAASSVYSIVTNPGEDASTQMNIGWHADLDHTECFITCTERSDAQWANAVRIAGASQRSDVFDGILSKTPSGEDFHEQAVFLGYGATLSGLRPDTNYMYRICAGDGAESPVHYFKTAGADSFSFVWISDFHAYTPLPNRLKNAAAVLDAAVEIDPEVQFIFSTGDVVAWGGSYSFWKDLYEQDFVRNYMFANVIGNHDAMTRKHDISSDYFRIVNNLPRNGYAGQEGVCYWFLYGDVLFITLNNEVMVKNPKGEAAAKEWAAGVIRSLKGRYRRIFLAEHYQWFDGRNGRTSWYANWKDFCDEHGVTLALAGNNHIYKRSHPLLGDRVVPAGKGTVYMEAPSSDGERGVEAGELTHNADKLAFTWSSHDRYPSGSVKTIGCVLVRVTPDSITTRLVYIDSNRKVNVADAHTLHLPATPPPSQPARNLPAAQDRAPVEQAQPSD